MNIESIKKSFTDCVSVTHVHWLHGFWTGRSIGDARHVEICGVIDHCRSDAISHITKTQHATSEEV